MLFFQYDFIFAFLPVTLAGYYLLQRTGRRDAPFLWLAGASIVFYGAWDWGYVPILVASVAWNYLIGLAIARGRRRSLLWLGIAGNLALLGYFKYLGFFGSIVGMDRSTVEAFGAVALPLGISFFTFQQIAYLVDLQRGEIRPPRLPAYLLFVTFFPQLVAGPIVHHREMLPQFFRKAMRLRASDLAVGSSIFFMGLFKKVVLADGIAGHANAVFDGAAAGVQVEFFEAWFGAVAFGLQLYFDFSAYSDMAIGLARLFGIRLPLNFFSPYKAVSAIDFWRRWHRTLSRFLRDMLYIPLGGNRKGPARRHLNLMVTMLLGGLWHGAGWTFIIWGGLHGLYLVVAHLWQGWRERHVPGLALPRPLAVIVTFALVTFAWVPFRAAGFEATWLMWETMLGLRGISLPLALAGPLGGLGALPGLRFEGMHSGLLVHMPHLIYWCLGGLAFVFFLPNVAEIMRRYRPTVEDPARAGLPVARLVTWRPTLVWALFVVLAMLGAIVLGADTAPDFLYYQF